MAPILAALCEDASVDANGRLTLVRIFRTIESTHFPFVHPRMFLAASIPIPPSDQLDRWSIQVDLINSDGRRLDRVVDDSRLMVGFPGDPTTFTFTAELKNLTFDTPGDYQFSIFINGTVAHALELNLRQRVLADTVADSN